MKIFASCHNHSCFSDAEYSPEQLVKLAVREGHGGIILTDHDTVSGTYFTNKAARQAGLKSILGCEFSTYHGSLGVHLLGFDFNPENKKMAELLARCSGIQTERSRLMFEWGIQRGTLRDGITWQQVRDEFPYNDYLCNNQVFVAMKKHGIYRHEEYNEFLMKNFSHSLGLDEKIREITGYGYRDISTEQVVKTIIEAGGVAVVAHPGGAGHKKAISEFLEIGIMGFETRHPMLTGEEHLFYEQLCEEKALYKMGGSDHSGVLGGNLEHGDKFICPYEMSGILEEDFMRIYERKLG